jgi:MFS family permease
MTPTTDQYSDQQKNNLAYPIVVISLCACFLFYKYVLQVYPNIITEQLMREFQLSGAGLGNLAATFYYAYMITQLFVGVILDKYSARWITALAIFSCALGVFLFANTYDLLAAELQRTLMGAGVAFATIAYMKLGAVWFPPRHYALISGLLASSAMAGAVFGTAPLALIINHIGWRSCLSAVGIVGFVLAFLFIVIVRDTSATTQEARSDIPMKAVLSVFKSPQNWLLTLYSGLACAPMIVFGGLWGNPFLQQAFHLSKTEASSLVSLVFIGLGLGSPLFGMLSMLSDQPQSRKKLMFYGTLFAMISVSIVLYSPTLPVWLIACLLFSFGLGLGAFPLVFTIGKEINSPLLTATVISMINASEAFLDAITEPAIGKILDLGWDGTILNGVHIFSTISYRIALSILPIYLLVAALLLFWIKVTRQPS